MQPAPVLCSASLRRTLVLYRFTELRLPENCTTRTYGTQSRPDLFYL